MGLVHDSRTGRPVAAYRRGRVIAVDSAAEQRLTDLLGHRDQAWSVSSGCVRIDPDTAVPRLDDEPTPWAQEHLLTAAEQIGGNPFGAGHGQPGRDGYGVPDRSRGPVTLTVPEPPRSASTARPRIVVLDTGLGEHPWLTGDVVESTIVFADGTVAGPFTDDLEHPDADTIGMVPQPLLGTLGSHVGHGTFIAGLVRQTCPEAVIVSPGIMGADGVVPESTLLEAVDAVLRKVTEDPSWAVAVVLSLGFYTEEPADLLYTSRLRSRLWQLGRAGVAVFCAAGNDASDRPSFPAAFAVDPAWDDPEVVPLVSVAALNPDGAVAQFSNDGPWVTAAEIGVNLVSTVPRTADGSSVPGRRWAGPGGRLRAGSDHDDFDSGFACWSGTSFAAPVLAGRYVRDLVAAGSPTDPGRRRLLVQARLGRPAGVLLPS